MASTPAHVDTWPQSVHQALTLHPSLDWHWHWLGATHLNTHTHMHACTPPPQIQGRAHDMCRPPAYAGGARPRMKLGISSLSQLKMRAAISLAAHLGLQG